MFALSKGDRKVSTEQAMQEMLKELVGDMLPAPLRPHTTLPILDSLNGPTGLITAVRTDMGPVAKAAKISTLVKELVTALGTVVFGCNRFITRRAIDALQGIQEINCSMTHVRKLDSLENERNLLNLVAASTRRKCELNGLKAETAEYAVSVLRAIYRARWLQNKANFEHFVLEFDRQNRIPGGTAARGKVLLMECRGVISKFHSALIRRILELTSETSKWTLKEKEGWESDVVPAAINADGGRNKVRRRSSQLTETNLRIGQSPTLTWIMPYLLVTDW